MNKTEEFLRESNAIEGVFDEDSYKQALIAWNSLIEQKELTLGVIMRTHALLMAHQDLPGHQKGMTRMVPVWIGGREAMPWFTIRPYLDEWIKKANEDKKWEDIKLSHVAYEFCHPFVDGNGRTGRMFMNWARLKNGLEIKVIKDNEKQEYYKWFN